MSPLRLTGSTSGYSQIDAPAVAGDQTFTLPGTGGTLDRLNRAGNILQVVSAAKTDTFTTTSTSFVDVTGLSVSITPASASSKILILAYVVTSNDTANRPAFIQLVRNTTAIFIGDSASPRTSATGGNEIVSNLESFGNSPVYLDAPSTTSSVTYKIQLASKTSGTAVINRSGLDDSGDRRGRLASSITVMEVAA